MKNTSIVATIAANITAKTDLANKANTRVTQNLSEIIARQVSRTIDKAAKAEAKKAANLEAAITSALTNALGTYGQAIIDAMSIKDIVDAANNADLLAFEQVRGIGPVRAAKAIEAVDAALGYSEAPNSGIVRKPAAPIERMPLQRYSMYQFTWADLMAHDPTGIKILEHIDHINVIAADKELKSWQRYNEIMPIMGTLQKLVSSFTKTNAGKLANIKMVDMVESYNSTIAGVTENEQTTKICSFTHNTYNLIPHPNGIFSGDNKELKKQKFEELHNAIVKSLEKLFIANGISAIDENGNTIHWHFWVATSSQVKVGKCFLAEDSVWNNETFQAKRRSGMTKEQFENIGVQNQMKLDALGFTASAPASRYGYDLRLKDIAVCKSIGVNRKIKNGYEVKANASVEAQDDFDADLTMADGQAVLVSDIPSCQMRFNTNGKAFAVNLANFREVLADMGETVSDTITLYDGTTVELDKVKMITTTDAYKASKFWSKWADYVATCEQLGIDEVRICRFADEEIDLTRKLARQLIQQLFMAEDEDLLKLAMRSLTRLCRFNTVEGAIMELSRVDEAGECVNELSKLLTAYPLSLDIPEIHEMISETYNNRLARTAGGKIEITNSYYPFIAHDPVAMLQVLLCGADPNRTDLGLLARGEVSMFNEKDSKPVYMVRYPANSMVGMVRTNRDLQQYVTCGNVLILSWNDEVIVIADGDFDGDEMFVSENKTLIDLTIKSLEKLGGQRVTIFPHDKGPASNLSIVDQQVEAIFNGQKFNLVGPSSNLATKMLNYLNKDMPVEKMQHIIKRGLIPHVCAILAIDMMKTGYKPEELIAEMEKLREACGMMPWNQRFVKHTTDKPWFDSRWNDETEAQSNSVCDRLAALVLKYAHHELPHYFNGIEPDWHMFLSNMDPELLRQVNAHAADKRIAEDMLHFGSAYERNMMAINNIAQGKAIKLSDFATTLYCHSAAIMKSLAASSDTDKSTYAEQYKAFTAYCRNTLGEFCRLSEEDTIDNGLSRAANLLAKNFFESKKVSGVDVAKKHRYLKWLLDVFGGVYAKHVRDNLNGNWVPPVELTVRYINENGHEAYRVEKSVEAAEKRMADLASRGISSRVTVFDGETEVCLDEVVATPVITYEVSYVDRNGILHTNQTTDRDQGNAWYLAIRKAGYQPTCRKI